MLVRVAPSLLSADFLHLWDEAVSILNSGADLLHLDVMDGHFVPNLTFGPKVAEVLTRIGKPLDVHLMVTCLDWAVPRFCQALSGSEKVGHYVTIHQEATSHLHRWLKFIRDNGLKAGVALNPSTDPSFLSYLLSDIDLILIMTVNPGWGGQTFIPSMLEKVEKVREMIDSSGKGIELEVDGGINRTTGALAREKGATILVAGNYVFSSKDRAAAIKSLRA